MFVYLCGVKPTNTKPMKTKIVHIDTLNEYCGSFTSQTDANSGYGCNHPECKDSEMLWKDEHGYTHRGYEDDPSRPKTKQGKCYDYSCPLACRCDVQDLKEHQSDMLEDYKDEDDADVADYVVCFDEEVLQKMSADDNN